MEVVSINEVHYDYTILSAQLELMKADPTFIIGPGRPPPRPALPHTKLTRVFRAPLHPIRNSDATGAAEQVQYGHVHRAQSGCRHDRTLRPPHHSVFKTIQTPEQYPV